jgi:D-sedoheptulose 7-phosphate isomerase
VTSLERHAATLARALGDLGALEEPLRTAADAIATSLASGGKLLAAGNGGSAAEAQHMTAEMVGRLHPDRERAGLAAVALHADTSALTAVGNDYGYEQVFARQVEAIGRPGDVLVVLSTSGASRNLVHAVDAANAMGMVTVAMVGASPRPLHERCAHVLAAPSDHIPTVQECHLVLVHVLVEEVEDALDRMSEERDA